MKKFRDCDWLREMQFFDNTVQKKGGVDKTRNMEHPGTFRNIPEHPGTSRNIPEHEKIKIFFMKKKNVIK